MCRLRSSQPAARLFGIDPVREMLDLALRRLPADVDLSEGSVEHLPYADDAFDLVASCNVFHYLADPLRALSEMRKVLKPGGTLVVTDWCADYLVCRMCEWYLSIFRNVRYRVYRQRECVSLLERAGFTDSAAERYKISWLWGVMTATAKK